MTVRSYANPEVLAFYEALPFNYYRSAEADRDSVLARNALDAYPVLKRLLRPGTRVLDVGCGAGWFVNSAAFHAGCDASGIDFNPVAVERARAVAALLGASSHFEVADLFLYRPESRFDVVNSIGVLHHTDNCLEGVRLVCRELVRPGGFVHIGLYHLYGRKPFLDHFEELKRAGVPEERMLEEFSMLHPGLQDRTHLVSWFRDQVLHPHETQHTLKEMVTVFEEEEITLLSTSINAFGRIQDLEMLFEAERTLEQRGQEQLRAKKYFPGFFTVLGRRR